MNLSEARELAEYFLKEAGLLAAGWRFEFDSAKRRFGSCDYADKKITLSPSVVLLNNYNSVGDVILHEIAHALLPSRVGHGPIWVAKARALGCDAKRLYGPEVTTPPRVYVATCRFCGRVVRRHRRNKIACGNCCEKHNRGRFHEKFLLTWEKAKRGEA